MGQKTIIKITTGNRESPKCDIGHFDTFPAFFPNEYFTPLRTVLSQTFLFAPFLPLMDTFQYQSSKEPAGPSLWVWRQQCFQRRLAGRLGGEGHSQCGTTWLTGLPDRTKKKRLSSLLPLLPWIQESQTLEFQKFSQQLWVARPLPLDGGDAIDIPGSEAFRLELTHTSCNPGASVYWQPVSRLRRLYNCMRWFPHLIPSHIGPPNQFTTINLSSIHPSDLYLSSSLSSSPSPLSHSKKTPMCYFLYWSQLPKELE